MKYFLTLLSGLCYLWLGYFVPRENFWALISGFSILFGCYFYFLKNEISINIALVFRLILLFSIPALSDDFYRFIWDGRLLAHGINPYLVLPSKFVQTTDYQRVIGEILIFEKLNSPNYYTIYPPLNQIVFGVSAWISGKNVFMNVVFLRAFILLAEFGTIRLLTQKKNILRTQHLALYIFNPFIILELTGNLHFEAIIIFFLLTSLYFFKKNKLLISAIFFALAVSTKLLPLIFIPLIIQKNGWKKSVFYTIIVSSINIILFVPFVDNVLITNFLSSIDLYFQKFEFNASIYYLVREIGFLLKGYNIIGTAGILLALLTMATIIWLSFKKKLSIENCILFILTIYFLMATTVHPWYISTLLMASVFTKFRYPVVWSMMLPLTYYSYAVKPYHENLILVFLEYFVVLGMIIYELKTTSRQSI